MKVYREREGYITKILTTQEIKNNFPGQDLQEKIRNAIRLWHDSQGVQYVFLAADDDSLPARVVLVSLGYGDDDYIPSDYYYMCLDGNWNSDGDYTFGELEDSVDLYPEVAVTRGTFHSEDEFMDYVHRVETYEKFMGSYVKRALFHSSTVQSGADGSEYVDQIANAFPDSIEKHFLYQDEQNITVSDINYYLAGGIGYFLTMAHGDINGFYANYPDAYYGISNIPDTSTRSTLVDIFSCHSGAIDRACLLEGFFSHGITIAARASSRNDFSFTTSMRDSFYDAIMSGENLGDATLLFRLPFLSYGSSGNNGYRYIIMSMITLGEPLIRFYSSVPGKLMTNFYSDSANFHVRVFKEDSLPAEGVKVVLFKDSDYMIIDTTDLNGEIVVTLSSLESGKHFLTLTGYNFLRLDTTVCIDAYNRPVISNISLSGVNGEENINAGAPVLLGISGNTKTQLPLVLDISCSCNGNVFYKDSFYVREEFVVSDTPVVPWFTENAFLKCEASFRNTNFFKDTTVLVYGPKIEIGGIRFKKDTFHITLVNSGSAPSDTIKINVNGDGFNSYFHAFLEAREYRIISVNYSGDLPATIKLKSNVIDTEFLIKDATPPDPPPGLVATSISEGVKLKWEKEEGLYNVYRGTDSTNLSRVNISPLKFPYFNDMGLSFDTTYYYAVTSINSSGIESDLSEIVKGIPNPRLAPGWPATASGLGYSSPLVADITPLYPGKEIVIGSFEDSLVYAFSKDGILLPGWPVKMDGIIYASPSGYDLDGDGFDEVVVAGYSVRLLWVLKGDGTCMDGWPVYLPNGNFTGPVIADLNNDSLPEIVFVSRKGGVYVYNTQGSLLDSIHLYSGGFSPASVGDINEDDTLDIVVGCKTDSAGLWVLHIINDTDLVVNAGFPKGPFGFNSPLVIGDVREDIPGKEIFGCSTSNYAVLFDASGDTIWTRPVNNMNYFYSPSISDIDGDGVPELLVNQGTGVAVFKNDGSYFQGYPTTKAYGGTHQCITVDLNKDGYKEIIKGSVDGNLYALTQNAGIYPGFPIDLKGYAYPTSTVSDVDGDGTLELIAASFSNLIFVYELGVPDSFIGDWPTYQHDNQRTGNYNYIPVHSEIEEQYADISKTLAKDLIVTSRLYFGMEWKNVSQVALYDVTGRNVLSIKKPFGRSVRLKSGVYFGIVKLKNGTVFKNRILVLP